MTRAEEIARGLYNVRRCAELGLWDVRLAGRIVFTVETEERAHATRDEHAAPIAAAIAAAEQAALASERATMLAHVESEAKCYREHGLDGAESALGIVANWLRDRAALPAPGAAERAERAVVKAAIEWRSSLDGPGECWHEARVRDSVDALAAARKGGE